jgi:hypothetical protein
MGTLLGTSAAVSTWAKFRNVMGIEDRDDSHLPEIYPYSAYYLQGLKSASDGSGLIRYPRLDSTGPGPTIYNGFHLISIGPPINYGNQLTTAPNRSTGGTSYESQAVTNEVQAELTGQTATSSTGVTVVISSSLWTANSQYWRSNISDAPIINGVGKLLAFYS